MSRSEIRRLLLPWSSCVDHLDREELVTRDYKYLTPSPSGLFSDFETQETRGMELPAKEAKPIVVVILATDTFFVKIFFDVFILELKFKTKQFGRI